tara:strand:- start:1485 stop:2177 length:693 start_codon:yes stop_codon:yes gene_type:complete
MLIDIINQKPLFGETEEKETLTDKSVGENEIREAINCLQTEGSAKTRIAFNHLDDCCPTFANELAKRGLVLGINNSLPILLEQYYWSFEDNNWFESLDEVKEDELEIWGFVNHSLHELLALNGTLSQMMTEYHKTSFEDKLDVAYLDNELSIKNCLANQTSFDLVEWIDEGYFGALIDTFGGDFAHQFTIVLRNDMKDRMDEVMVWFDNLKIENRQSRAFQEKVFEQMGY